MKLHTFILGKWIRVAHLIKCKGTTVSKVSFSNVFEILIQTKKERPAHLFNLLLQSAHNSVMVLQ